MTQTVDYQPASGDADGPHCPYHNRISAICAWIVILISVAVIITLNRLESAATPPEASDAVAPNVQLEIISRYIVGSADLLPHAAAQPGTINPADLYTRQLDAVAKSDADHLRIAIVAGELGGGASALQRINKLISSPGSPEVYRDAAHLQFIYHPNPLQLDDEIRQHLVDRYGWFGHLALAFGKGPGDPDRMLALQAAKRAMVVLLCVGFAAIAAFVAGIVLFIIALVHLADGKIRRAYVPVVSNTVPFLEAFALYLALMIGVSFLVGRYSGHMTLNAKYLVAGCVPVATALVWPLLRRVTWPQLRYGLGWHLGTGLLPEMFWGIVGYIAGLPLLAIGAIITLVLSKWSGAQTAHPIINQAAGAASALRLFLLASVFAPLAEESLFRGALFHHLRRRHAWWVSALIVSLIFAAIHPQGWAAIPPLGMIALTFAAIREWRGTIVASATAHALNNGVIMLVLVIGTS